MHYLVLLKMYCNVVLIHTINYSVKVWNERSHPTNKIVDSIYCQYNLQETFDCEKNNSIVVNHDYLRVDRLF